MWRLFNILKWINLLLASSPLLAFLIDALTGTRANNTLYLLLWEDEQVRPYFILAVILDALLLSASAWSYYKKRKRENTEKLREEFEFLKPSEELTPADLDYEPLEVGEESKQNKRPHYKAYIPRFLVEGEKRTKANSDAERIPDTKLAELIKNKTSFAVIGPPTDGKSRTLFETLSAMRGIMIMKPHIDSTPSVNAIRLYPDKLTVVFLDNLNEFATDKINIWRFIGNLEESKIRWTIVCGCRGGSELAVVKEPISSPFSRFYHNKIDKKFFLAPPSRQDKRDISNRLFPDQQISDEELDIIPTIGAEVMAGDLKAMKDRFETLEPKYRDCLASFKMLVRGGVLPLTHERINAVMLRVFGNEPKNLSHILEQLDNQSFITSARLDPVRPEMAYLRYDGPKSVVTNPLNLPPNEELKKLADTLESIDDAGGIFSVAFALGEMDCNNDAIETYDKLIDKFGAEKESTLKEDVAWAILAKGLTQGKLDKSGDEIETYDELITKFGNEKESALKKVVARAMLVKGARQVELNRPDDSFSTLCKAWARKDDLIPEHLTLLEKAFKAINRSPADCP